VGANKNEYFKKAITQSNLTLKMLEKPLRDQPRK